MISKNIYSGLKVVPIAKSVGQSFVDWRDEYLGDAKYVVVEKFISKSISIRPYGNFWICGIPGTVYIGHFLAKDLVPYEED